MAEALHAAIGTPAKFSPLTIDGTAKPLISDLVGGFMGAHRPTRPRQRRLRDARRRQSGRLPRPRDRDAQPDGHDPRHREARPRSGSSTRAAPRPRDWPPATSRRARAPTTRCWRTWCARCCATAPTPMCRLQDADELAAAVEPFTLEHTAARRRRVPRRELTQLLAAVRRAGRVAIDTGTGVTMTAERQRHAMARVGADDPHRRDEPARRHVVPSRVRLPARDLRAAGLTARGFVRARARAAVRRRKRSSANGRAPCCPTRSTRATSAPSSTSAAAWSPRSPNAG